LFIYDDDDDDVIADWGCSVEKCNIGRRSNKSYRDGDHRRSQRDWTTTNSQPQLDTGSCSRLSQFADQWRTSVEGDLQR